jgi:hypothetical protein
MKTDERKRFSFHEDEIFNTNVKAIPRKILPYRNVNDIKVSIKLE